MDQTKAEVEPSSRRMGLESSCIGLLMFLRRSAETGVFVALMTAVGITALVVVNLGSIVYVLAMCQESHCHQVRIGLLGQPSSWN